VGVAAVMIPAPWGANDRTLALIKLGEVSVACMIASWPAVSLTKSISAEERRAVISILIPWRSSALPNE
jgi:hypothetical protein